MKQYNRKIEILRAYAIFAVVCAHSVLVYPNSPSTSKIVADIISYYSMTGVPCFFFISGIFFASTKDNLVEFVKKKINTTIIPSLFCFTALWLFVALRKGGLNLRKWLGFIDGKDSSAYFIVMLMALYVICWLGRASKVFTIIGIALSVAWYVLKVPLGLGGVDSYLLSEYHNVLYWLGYFCTGMLLTLTKSVDKVFEYARRYLWASLTFSIIIVAFLYFQKKPAVYFSNYSFFVTMIFLFTTIGLSALDIYGNGKCIERMGNYAFTIFLLHQFFAGAVVRVTAIADSGFTVLIRPFLTILIVCMLLSLHFAINNRLNGKLEFVNYLIGIREKGDSHDKV